MKKFNLLIGAFALAGLVACSSDDVVKEQNLQALQTTQGITFSPLSKNATRSSVLAKTSDMTSFRVLGKWAVNITAADAEELFINGANAGKTAAISEGTVYEGFDANTPKGLEIVANNGGWDYKNTTDIQYWPFVGAYTGSDATNDKTYTGYTCQALDFYAVTPANCALDLTANTWNGYTTPAVANMVDICYAQAKGKTNAGGAVNMEFKHLLSQIVFKAKKNTGYVVDIKSVKIGGVKPEGDMKSLDLYTTAFTKDNIATFWDAKGTATAYDGYTSAAAFSVPDQDASDAPATLTPSKQELLLIPQVIDKWDAASSAIASGKGYIAITYRLKLNTSTTWATQEASDPNGYTTTYFPLEAFWAPGKLYVYTLLFGGATDPGHTPDPENPDPGDDNPGGYTEEGGVKPPSVPITFTASVSDWESTSVDVKF